MYPWKDSLTGMHPGCEHQGKPLPPMREKRQLLHSSCYLVARWILVWTLSPNRCVSLTARKSTPQPSNQGESSMNAEGNTRVSRRYIALDIHKHYCVIAGVDREGRVVLQPVRVEHADLEGWLKKDLRASDHVVIESTTNAWHVYDLLAPLAERVVVANPIQVKQIACARVKTDIRDTLILARLLAANLVPDVWVPPLHVRQLRQLLSQRRQLVETHTQIVNRMHSVAHRHHLKHERGKRFNEKNTAWQRDKSLSRLEQFQLELEMENRVYIEKQISRMGKEVTKMCHQKPWAREYDLSHATARLWSHYCNDRAGSHWRSPALESPKKLASYSGLTPGLEQSGTKKRGKGITKEGRRN